MRAAGGNGVRDWLILTMHTVLEEYILMKSRISITLDPHIHRNAQRLAKARGTTLSGLVESLLSRQLKAESSGVVDRLVGSAVLRQSSEVPDGRWEHLRRKYLSS
jgi:hypothetical protein